MMKFMFFMMIVYKLIILKWILLCRLELAGPQQTRDRRQQVDKEIDRTYL